ncbi:cytochrome P450 [Clohesyomyces aquaticus]|uniref:Cytochrome P450 n=1 Tax=Clohesyomyces aquaticus TaxID=1231657 RepID=A0A1Y2AAN3_9PLEO|nr:cytochrome P450 [Clohesyomyces aquaticus]
MTSFSVVLIASAVVLFVLYKTALYAAYSIRRRRNGCEEPPKYPHRDPLFGLDLFFAFMNAFKAGQFLDWNKCQYDKFGRTFKANSFGSTIFKTIDPEVSKAVHATYFANFGLQPLRYDVAENFWGNGIIVVDGPHWQHGRALIRSSFDVVHIANFERLKRHAERFMELLPRDGKTIDLMLLFKRLILDTTSEFIFGEPMGALDESKACDDFMDAFAYAQKGTAIRAMLGRLKFMHRDKKWWDSCKHVTDYIDVHVDKAIARLSARDGTRNDAEIDGRLRLADEMAQDTQDKLTLRSHMLSVFSPAHDGAAVALSNACFHLARNPEEWAKLRSEILPTRNEPLTYDLLNSYKYLSWVLKENGKKPLYVEEGNFVEINYRAMCRDETFWGTDADQFKPERWETTRPGWEYTPFGGGPRTCPGMRLVFTESAYVLVTFLREFKKLENRDPELEWKEEMRMTFQSKNGCLVGLIPDSNGH